MNQHVPAWSVRTALIGALLLWCQNGLAQPGTLDATFDPLGGVDNTVTRVLARPDGSVIVGGQFTTFNGSPAASIVQLFADGTVDTGFNTGTGFDGRVLDMALQPDGKLIVCGSFTTYNGTTLGRRLVRLLTNGSLDPDFTPPTYALSSINSVALRSDGRIVVGGNMGSTLQTRVARLLSTGAEDPEFNTFLALNQSVHHVEVFGDGRILVAGVFTSHNAVPRAGLCVLDPNGGLNTTFDPGTGLDQLVSAAVVTPDDKIILGGNFSTYNGGAAARLIQLNDDGTVDTGFNTGLGITGGTVLGMYLRADGRLLCVGGFTSYNGTARSRICSILPNGSVDLTFDPGIGPNSQVQSVCRDEFDRVVIGGDFTSFSGTARVRVARLFDCATLTWYADADGDGLGDPGTTALACIAPAEFVANADDCDDTDPDIGPALTWYFDGDEDEFGDPNVFVTACIPPPGYVLEGTDCDDTDPFIVMGEACDDGDPYTVNDVQTGYPECGCVGQKVVVSARAMLQGPYDANTGLMRDDLRVAGLIPLTEPYTALQYAFAPGSLAGGDTVGPAVLAVTGPDAIVDWVVLELRAGWDAGIKVTSRCALIQRDGDIVDLDGISPVQFPTTHGYYRLAVLHRNHMGVVESDGAFPNGSYYEVNQVDLTSPAVVVQGAAPRAVAAGVMLLRAGDSTFNDNVLYVGNNNDRDPILFLVGGSIPTATLSGYFTEDINMDGVVKYTGQNNDRDPILVTIGGTIPTAVRPNVY